MISVVIPTHNAAATLPAAFRSLLDATIDGLVSEVIVADCGSTDATLKIADAAGATVIQAGRGQQLLAGAQAARKPWLLFLERRRLDGRRAGRMKRGPSSPRARPAPRPSVSASPDGGFGPGCAKPSPRSAPASSGFPIAAMGCSSPQSFWMR